jgi:hypothetical protein
VLKGKQLLRGLSQKLHYRKKLWKLLSMVMRLLPYLEERQAILTDAVLCLAVDPFPSEEYRRALGERIELTEQQVQVTHSSCIREHKQLAWDLSIAVATKILLQNPVH